ncbi:MAG: helix-turn-helix domain-containing protein [Erysipelotrichaceae bacterium]|nr:helix-turn-helix domain-containing protein [Erysipelotrichaceae bacterium]
MAQKNLKDQVLRLLMSTNEELTLDDIALEVSYSKWYLTRKFKEETGETLMSFVKRTRMICAANNMFDKKIMDVALDTLYRSHEGFSRAFFKMFDVSPREYKRKMRLDPQFVAKTMNDVRKRIEEGGILMSETPIPVFVQVISKPERQLVCKKGKVAEDYFAYCEEVGCDVWDTLLTIKEALGEPMGMWLGEHLVESGTSKYIQGVEVPLNFQGDIPSGFSMMQLPACDVMIFQGPPYPDADFSEAIGQLWQVMEHYDPRRVGYEWADDLGGSFQLEPRGERGYIEGRTVKRV